MESEQLAIDTTNQKELQGMHRTLSRKFTFYTFSSIALVV
jgi:hypothetical protein